MGIIRELHCFLKQIISSRIININHNCLKYESGILVRLIALFASFLFPLSVAYIFVDIGCKACKSSIPTILEIVSEEFPGRESLKDGMLDSSDWSLLEFCISELYTSLCSYDSLSLDESDSQSSLDMSVFFSRAFWNFLELVISHLSGYLGIN